MFIKSLKQSSKKFKENLRKFAEIMKNVYGLWLKIWENIKTINH